MGFASPISASGFPHTDPVALVHLCSALLTTSAAQPSPLTRICELLVEHGGLREASFHILVPGDPPPRCVAHAGENQDCRAVREFAGEHADLVPVPSRNAKTLVRPSPDNPSVDVGVEVRPSSSPCLLLPFQWDDRARGLLHVHASLRTPISADLEGVLTVLARLVAWRASSPGGLRRSRETAAEPPTVAATQPLVSSPALVLSRIADIVTHTTADGMILYVSPSVEAILGYYPEELVGTPLLQLVRPDDASAVSSAFRSCDGTRARFDYRARHASGRFIVMSAAAARLHGASGERDTYITTHRDQAPQSSSARTAPGATASGRRDLPYTVLVVDDEDYIRIVVAKLLEGSGYRVLVASSGPDALRIWRDSSAAIDLVLTDLLMPDMTGAELLEELRATRPGLPAIYMSGFPSSVRSDFRLDGTIPFLQKPFQRAALLEVVEQSLGKTGGWGQAAP